MASFDQSTTAGTGSAFGWRTTPDPWRGFHWNAYADHLAAIGYADTEHAAQVAARAACERLKARLSAAG